jgi:hypothetical protein
MTNHQTLGSGRFAISGETFVVPPAEFIQRLKAKLKIPQSRLYMQAHKRAAAIWQFMEQAEQVAPDRIKSDEQVKPGPRRPRKLKANCLYRPRRN